VYLARTLAGESPAAGPAEVLAPATARGEAMFLALRTREGVDPTAFTREFGAPPARFWPDIAELVRDGLLESLPAGSLRLTPRGRRIADTVFARFV
jgi:coproporphyrinogen III oxidase-like Fe-S oxidoreductase